MFVYLYLCFHLIFSFLVNYTYLYALFTAEITKSVLTSHDELL